MSDGTKVSETPCPENLQSGEELLPVVYQELRRLAAHRMTNEFPHQTLQPTALVHEAWMRLGGSQQRWEGRAHFFAAAAEAMRRILIETARRKRAIRRGGNQKRVDLELLDIAAPDEDERLIEVSDALDRYEKNHRTEASLVKLRFFVGLSIEEAAEALDISPRSAKYYWTHARAWLFRELNRNNFSP